MVQFGYIMEECVEKRGGGQLILKDAPCLIENCVFFENSQYI